MIKFALFLSALFLYFNGLGQTSNLSSIYIEKYKEDAIKEMMESGVPASIILSQGILESGNGTSELALNANNHFGIKCHQDWNGDIYIIDDDEKNECFRKYHSVFESYKDHSVFLKSRPRYNSLFTLAITDYKGWANGLKKAGYATNPKYPDLLISIIEKNKLYKYDSLYLTIEHDSLSKNISPLFTENDKKYQTVNGRKIYSNNKVPFIIYKTNDDISKLCKDLDLRPWQIFKYNDLAKNSEVKPGQIIYIKPKRSKNPQEFHLVKNKETMHSISQKYGIKLKKLYAKNNLPFGSELTKGQKISLKKKIRIN